MTRDKVRGDLSEAGVRHGTMGDRPALSVVLRHSDLSIGRERGTD